MKHLILLLLISAFGYGQAKQQDYIIAQKIIQKINFNQEDTIYLALKTENRSIASLYERNFKDSILYEQEKNRVWLSKGSYKADTKILEKVFTQENYEHIKLQIGESTWDISKIDKLKSVKVLPASDSKMAGLKTHSLYISKPLYTNNKYALIKYSYEGRMALLIYELINEEWTEVKFIPLGIS